MINSYPYICLHPYTAEIYCFKQKHVLVAESEESVRFNVIRTGDGVDESCIQYSITDVTTQGKFVAIYSSLYCKKGYRLLLRLICDDHQMEPFLIAMGFASS